MTSLVLTIDTAIFHYSILQVLSAAHLTAMIFLYSLSDTKMNIQGSLEGHKKSYSDTVKSEGVCACVSKVEKWPHQPLL